MLKRPRLTFLAITATLLDIADSAKAESGLFSKHLGFSPKKLPVTTASFAPDFHYIRAFADKGRFPPGTTKVIAPKTVNKSPRISPDRRIKPGISRPAHSTINPRGTNPGRKTANKPIIG